VFFRALLRRRRIGIHHDPDDDDPAAVGCIEALANAGKPGRVLRRLAVRGEIGADIAGGDQSRGVVAQRPSPGACCAPSDVADVVDVVDVADVAEDAAEVDDDDELSLLLPQPAVAAAMATATAATKTRELLMNILSRG
jgi:hypothetical protein